MHRHVYLVEDHTALREAYTELIDASDDLRVVGAAASAEAALADLPDVDVDVALVDVSLGGPRGTAHGIDLVGELHRRWPGLRVLVVSGHEEGLYAERALNAGARGYLMKHEASRDLLPAVRRVLHGDVVLSERMTACVPEALRAPIAAL